MKRSAATSLFTLALALFAAPVDSSTDPAFGYWETAEGKAIVEIGPCDGKACGRMVWLQRAHDEAGAPRRDADGRPLCGLALMTGLQRAGDGRWKDGDSVLPSRSIACCSDFTIVSKVWKNFSPRTWI